MPDPVQYMQALLAAFAVSFLAIAGIRFFFPLRVRRAECISEVVAAAAGLVAGYRILQFEWVWPPGNAINRFLTIVLPAAVVVELISAFAPVSSSIESPRLKRAGLFSIIVLILRASFFASIGRILLHKSVYVRVSPDIDACWSEWKVIILLAASAALLNTVWLLLSSLAIRDEPRSVITSLSLSIMTAGISIMLAGYIRGGAAGLPVAASLVGVVMATTACQPKFCVLNHQSLQCLIGPAVTVLFSLLWIGSLFGQLPAIDALTILVAPLLCWVSELAVFRRMNRRSKVALRLIAVVIPLTLTLVNAKRTFDQKLGPLVAIIGESLFSF